MRVKDKKGLWALFSFSLFLFAVILMYFRDKIEFLSGRSGLYQLAIIALLIFDAALISDIFGIAVAIVEIIFGVIASLMGLVPDSFLMDLGLIGGVLLMYVVGSEVNIDILRKHISKGFIIGFASFFGPFIISFIIFSFLGMSVRSSGLIAVSLSTTSVAVVYALLLEKSLVSSPTGQTLLSSAMIADVISIIVLTVIITHVSTLFLVYMVLFFVSPFVLRKLLHALPHGVSEVGLRLIISMLLVLTLFSEVVGFHAVLIAFILGLASSDIIRTKGALDEKIRGFVFSFFAPLFFFTAGMYVGGTDIFNTLWLVIIALLASYPAKIFFTYFISKIVLKTSDIGYSIMFGARLTVSTIAALLGLSTGMLSSSHYSAIIISAVIVTVLSGIFVGRMELLSEEEL